MSNYEVCPRGVRFLLQSARLRLQYPGHCSWAWEDFPPIHVPGSIVVPLQGVVERHQLVYLSGAPLSILCNRVELYQSLVCALSQCRPFPMNVA